jgi:hypothetical protein
MFVAPATAQEMARLVATVDLGVSIETLPDSDGVAHGNGVDLLAGYTSKRDGQKADGTRAGSGRRTGSAGDLERPAMCVSHKTTTTPSQWIRCDRGGLTDMVERHPQLLPTIAAPTTACTLCAPETTVRVSDLQNFPAPIAPTGMEPNGWAIVELAANFWTGASTHISEGLLLGQPAQVIFTPIGYHWNYGDGNTTTSTNGGASWEALGLAEFSNTDSSHVYTEKGSYSVVLTVEYRADYSFGDQGWRPVEGIVTVPATPFTVVAARESTVLVAEDCLTNPHGPGC